MINNAYFVYGLGFGDEGKGSIVDSLCITANNPIVIRYSGGQQCGHNVVINDELSHIHSSFGSGTLRGVPSYFTDDCTIYPASIVRERDVLLSKGVEPILHVHPFAKVTTPFDVAYGRVREQSVNHGSVGLGHGSTMHRHLKTGYKLHAIDLRNTDLHMAKLIQINRYYVELLDKNGYSLFEYESIVNNDLGAYLDSCAAFDSFQVSSPRSIFDELQYSLEEVDLIFEGSQGTLLDMDHGIFPNVTYSNTTVKNAVNFGLELGLSCNMHFVGVTRAYMTRHGKGWMPDRGQDFSLANSVGETNFYNEFQGNLRVASINYGLIDHANAINDYYIDKFVTGFVNKHMIVTCVDHLEDFTYEGKKDRDIILKNSPVSKAVHLHVI